MNLRIGSGFDVHKFEEERPLFLGGILIENHIGLAGHSDADVLIHAIIDALLGASAIGDIGELFPDTDNAFKNIRSTLLLEKVAAELASRGWEIVNIDSTVVCETPKISKYKLQMIKKLSEIMQIPPDSLMIKGKTTEKLGFAGRKEGIAAFATALLEKKS